MPEIFCIHGDEENDCCDDCAEALSRKSQTTGWKSDDEYRVIVTKMQGDFWYTLQRRRWVFSIPLWWSQVPPIWQPTYERAMDLANRANVTGEAEEKETTK